MDDYDMTQSIIPTARKHGGGAGGGSSATTALLVGALVILIIAVAFLMWRRRYRSRPNCASYDKGPAQACTVLSSVCGDDPACLNAVAHCMPVVSAAGGGIGAVSSRDLRACASAITNVNPVFMGQLATKFGGASACVPPMVAEALANPAEFAAIANGTKALAVLAPYAVEVARGLPACPKSGPVPVPPKKARQLIH
jgi:Tfp pilus assembly protein PilW